MAAPNPFNMAGSTAFSSSVDPVNDSVPFWQHSSNEAFWISQQTFLNIAGSPVGTTDSQTLTNKTLTSPTISGPTLSGTLTGTYTIGGTPTFPSSVVTLSGSQTLTNKTLTSPTINGGTVSNATVDVDTVAGYTTSGNGTIYGMSVTGGVLASAAIAGSVNTAALASGVQVVTKEQNPYKFWVYLTASHNIATAAVIPFDTNTTPGYDTGGNVDIVTNKGRFTAPVNGFYVFSYHLNLPNVAVSMLAYLYKNGSSLLVLGGGEGSTSSDGYISGSTLPVKLSATDYVEVWASASSTEALVTGSANCSFGGYLLSAT